MSEWDNSESGCGAHDSNSARRSADHFDSNRTRNGGRGSIADGPCTTKRMRLQNCLRLLSGNHLFR